MIWCYTSEGKVAYAENKENKCVSEGDFFMMVQMSGREYKIIQSQEFQEILKKGESKNV